MNIIEHPVWILFWENPWNAWFVVVVVWYTCTCTCTTFLLWVSWHNKTLTCTHTLILYWHTILRMLGWAHVRLVPTQQVSSLSESAVVPTRPRTLPATHAGEPSSCPKWRTTGAREKGWWERDPNHWPRLKHLHRAQAWPNNIILYMYICVYMCVTMAMV